MKTIFRASCSCLALAAVFAWAAGADEVRLFEGAEARPSADGARILFQRDTPAGRRVGIRTVADGTETWIDDRPGHGTFACWGAADEVVYTWGHEAKTAYAAQKDATGFNLWVWKDGARRQLTFGRERDYTPCVSPDGKTVFFSTTRGVHKGVFKNTVALWSVPMTGGTPSFLADVGGESCGMVSPQVSPDGRILVWAQVDRFFDAWHLQAARVDNPTASCPLTPRTFAAYSPAWHPDGAYLAFAGFKAGDPGWGVYLMDVASGALRRVADGRNPAFAADGKTLYYDRDGAVYSRTLAATDFPPAADASKEAARVAALEAETIHVRAKIVFQPAKGLSFVMRGASKVHPLTLQLFFRDPETVEFATRRVGDLTYAHLSRRAKFEPGRAYVLTGIRRGNELQISIDDDMPRVGLFVEGLMPLVEPEKIEKGVNFPGQIQNLRVARGWPAEVPRPISREALFRK